MKALGPEAPAGNAGEAGGALGGEAELWGAFAKKLAAWEELSRVENLRLRKLSEEQEQRLVAQGDTIERLQSQLREARGGSGVGGAEKAVATPPPAAGGVEAAMADPVPLQHLLPHARGSDPDAGNGGGGGVRAAARKKLCQNLRTHGFCLVQAPRALRVGSTIDRAYENARVFFRLPTERKDANRCPTEHGYLNPEGNYQCFQVKSRHGASFTWPGQGFQSAFVAAYKLLEQVALACFDVCAADLGCEPSGLRDLLDVDAPREVPARTAMRCIEYTRVEETRNEYADHTDLSFVTVAPRGSCAALRVRDMLSLKEVDVERAMGPDTLLVYCGDLMARLTGNSFPAAMHRPVGAWEGADANYRYALPFFLRGRSDAVLDPRNAGQGSKGGEPVPVWMLENNVGGSRDSFPWKKAQAYYSTFGFSA